MDRESLPVPLVPSLVSKWRPGHSGPREARLWQQPEVLRVLLGLAAKLRAPGRGLVMRWVARLVGGRTVRVETQWGGRFRSDWDDLYFLQPFAQEPLETAVVLRLLDPGEVFLDVGANRGWYTVLAAMLGARVLAVEADRTALRLLRRNIKEAGVTNRVIVLPYAATNTRSLAPFYSSSDSQLSRLGIESDHGPKLQGVETATLAGLLNDLGVSRIDFIKIDVEGAEAKVLEGLQGAAVGRPILLVESIERNLELFGATREVLEGTVEDVLGNYAALYLCRLHGRPELSTESVKCAAAKNVLFVPEERTDAVLERVFSCSLRDQSESST